MAKSPDVAIILSKLGKKPGRMEKPGADEDTGDDLEVCARHLVDAVKSGDSAGVASALRDAFAVLQAEPTDDTDEYDED